MLLIYLVKIIFLLLYISFVCHTLECLLTLYFNTGILGSGPAGKQVNPVGSLLHDVLTKANDSFFMPCIEKETERNVHNISSSLPVKKKRVIAFYHRVNENDYDSGAKQISNRIRPK